MRRVVTEEQWVTDGIGVEAFLDQLDFAVLECASDLDGLAQPNEKRRRVRRQIPLAAARATSERVSKWQS